jgi:hypothetical protein
MITLKSHIAWVIEQVVSGCKHWSDTFLFLIGLKEEYALSTWLFDFALECTIRKVQGNQDNLKLNETH